jgi:tRNA uridine 5-carboxymethylaminomethyl modification enzyme
VSAALTARAVPGLWLAGQVLGTSGYEEAAGLGLLAGINAALALRGEAPLVVGRDEGYLGVLVDDVVHVEHREPYRMLTSRAEHRLLLGIDSARERLMARGVELGLVPKRAFHVEHLRWDARERARQELERTRLNPSTETRDAVRRACRVEITAPTTWAGVLRRTDVDPALAAAGLEALSDLPSEDRLVVVSRVRYAGYLERQRKEVARVRRLREAAIPEAFEPRALPGLSREVLEALERHRPRSLGEAARLPGVTPAAVAILAGWLSRRREV